MGLELVSVLAEQIDGVIELTREPGTRFALTFAARP
jgi:two-component sensor histidine kinase